MCDGLIGLGFLIMLIGCAGADGSLTFAAVLIGVGALIIALGGGFKGDEGKRLD